jgi:hypothetical protein
MLELPHEIDVKLHPSKSSSFTEHRLSPLSTDTEQYTREEKKEDPETTTLSIEYSNSGRFTYAREGLLAIQDVEGVGDLGKSAHFKEYRRSIDSTTFALYGEDNKPVALVCQNPCALLNKEFTICGTQPVNPEDSIFQREKGVDFYPWLKVVDVSFLHYKPISIWNGNVFELALKAVPGDRLFEEDSLHSPLPHRRDIAIFDAKGADLGLLHKRVQNDENNENFIELSDFKPGYEVTVARGVDPYMMLCIAVALGEISGY